LGDAENGGKFDQNQVVQQQLSNWQKVRNQLEEDLQKMEEAAKTDKTGWFKRTGWLSFLKGRNLAHLAHQAQMLDQNEAKFRLAAELIERLIEKSVRGLSTLPQETRRWLRSVKQAEVDPRLLARLQNPESQATYAGYMVRFVCFYLRIIADAQAQAEASLLQPEPVVNNGNESSCADTSTESEYSDSNQEDSNSGTDNDSIAPQRRPRKTGKIDKMKDVRELFSWEDDQLELAVQLWVALGDSDRAAQMEALLNSLSSFILTSYGNNEFSCGLVQYLAVLGIDTETKRLRTAKNYSYMLAGMVYCIRVLAVEKILPSAERDHQTAEDRAQFLEMRRKYLADGSYRPMSAMVSLLAYGKHAALNDSNAGNIYWSPDKKIFYPRALTRPCPGSGFPGDQTYAYTRVV
jgi:hypothetical protein